MLCWCNSFATGAMQALKSIGPRTDPCGTPVVMLLTSDKLLFTRTTFVKGRKSYYFCREKVQGSGESGLK